MIDISHEAATALQENHAPLSFDVHLTTGARITLRPHLLSLKADTAMGAAYEPRKIKNV